MEMRRDFILVLACLVVAPLYTPGCKEERHYQAETIPVIPDPPPEPLPDPDWSIWGQPYRPESLEFNDIHGDGAPFGDMSDWEYLWGTYDTDYVYLMARIYDHYQGFDTGGIVSYWFFLDCDGNEWDPGDYAVGWDANEGWTILDYNGYSDNPGFRSIFFDASTVELAIPRSFIDESSFYVGVFIMYWSGDWMPGDKIPNGAARTLQFRF